MTREVPVSPSFPGSPEGTLQLWTSSRGLHVKMPGVSPKDMIRMGMVGVPDPWRRGASPMKFDLGCPGLFMNALHMNNQRLANEQAAQQSPDADSEPP